MKRGDIVLMVAPSKLGRPRPGVIVQADLFKDFTTIFICPISSDVRPDLPLRPTIEPKPSNGLRLRSQIMTDRMVALRRDRVRSIIGRADSEIMQELNQALLVVLGLAR